MAQTPFQLVNKDIPTHTIETLTQNQVKTFTNHDTTVTYFLPPDTITRTNSPSQPGRTTRPTGAATTRTTQTSRSITPPTPLTCHPTTSSSGSTWWGPCRRCTPTERCRARPRPAGPELSHPTRATVRTVLSSPLLPSSARATAYRVRATEAAAVATDRQDRMGRTIGG